MIPALILAAAAALGAAAILLYRRTRALEHAVNLCRVDVASTLEGELAGVRATATDDRVALQHALERLADELEAARLADLVGKRVTVHTTNGESIRGVVLLELEDGTLELQAARYLQPDGSELEADGRVRITGARRSWLQIVEG